MGTTTAACYLDWLAMRVAAQHTGFLVPKFCRVLNYDELRAYAAHMPAPWLLEQYSAEFAERFLAQMPPAEKPTD